MASEAARMSTTASTSEDRATVSAPRSGEGKAAAANRQCCWQISCCVRSFGPSVAGICPDDLPSPSSVHGRPEIAAVLRPEPIRQYRRKHVGGEDQDMHAKRQERHV